MKHVRTAFLLAGGVAACAQQPSPAPIPDPAAPVAANVYRSDPRITPDDLRQRLDAFADDSMEGREAGERGGVKAADYLAAELRRMGVEPAGENGTYFQTLPFTRRALDPATAIAVNGAPLALDTDYLPLPAIGDVFPFGMRGDLDSVRAVYGGRLGDASTIAPDSAAGRLVVFGPPTAPMNVQEIMAGLPRQYPGARGFAFAFLEFIPREQRGFMTEPQLGRGAGLPGGPIALIVTTETAARLLGTPLGGATVGQGTGVVSGLVRFTIGPLENPMRNVVGVVRGSDPVLAHQYVALGAHSDHVGYREAPVDHDSLRAFNRVVRPEGADDPMRAATAAEATTIRGLLDSLRAARSPRPDSIHNGADDDGSGSMTLLEIAEAAAHAPRKPRRSLLFVWHTGEEKGLYGSAYYTDNPTVPLDSIVAEINMDMVGRGTLADLPGGGPRYVQVIGSRRLSTELGDLLEAVNTRGRHAFNFDYQYDAPGHPQQFYCRSDHYMYARKGIPVVFFSTGAHADYHQVTDEAQYIDYPKMARVAELVRDFAWTVADLDHRVVVDKDKPDPNQACRQ